MKRELKTPEMVQSMLAMETMSVGAETLTFITQAGAADAGEAIGTIVYAMLKKAPILGLITDRLGEKSDDALSTSLSFTTDVMDSTKEVGFVYDGSLNKRLSETIARLSPATVANGSWALDYTTGLLVIKKKTAGTSQAITNYKVKRGELSTKLYTYLAGAVTKAVIKASEGKAFAFTVTNRNAAVRYLGLHNKATAPAAAEAPLVVFTIPATGQLTLGADWFGESGIDFSLGIGWSIGTTVATFTDAATANEHEVMVRYL